MSLLAKPGLLMIKTLIQKQLGYSIPWYDMVLNVIKNDITFCVPENTPRHDPHEYPYRDTQGVMNLIKTMTQKRLKTQDTIDIIIISYRKEGIEISVYYTDQKLLKQTKTINL